MDTKERDFACFSMTPAACRSGRRFGRRADRGLEEETPAGAPTIPFDYWQSPRNCIRAASSCSPTGAGTGHRSVADVEAGYRAELEAYLDAARIEPAEAAGATFVETGPQLSIEPEDIAFDSASAAYRFPSTEGAAQIRLREPSGPRRASSAVSEPWCACRSPTC